MEKNTYQLLRKNIPQISLVSYTSQNWYDSFSQLIPWSGSLYIGPNINEIIYNTNISGSMVEGYFQWDGTIWNEIPKSSAYDNYNLPIYLESSVDEMGGMVSFDGEMEQIEQLVNFSYIQPNQTDIQVFNTVNPNKLRKIIEQNYIIDWGDGNSETIPVNDGITPSFPTLTHTYPTPAPTLSEKYTITITLYSPWTIQKVSKVVTIGYDYFDGTITNPLGTFTGVTVPAYSNLTGQTQDYLTDLDYTNNTGYTSFTYLSLGRSRISEKKLYGENIYSGVTTGITEDNVSYSAYTIDNLEYRDYEDGYTSITGTTSGFTKEEVFDSLLTRNEHFLGFIEDPIIYSDIFVERGKQNVMEKNLRLVEIDNIGELDLYGNGYFTIKKQ
jgi:hypothetical protein